MSTTWSELVFTNVFYYQFLIGYVFSHPTAMQTFGPTCIVMQTSTTWYPGKIYSSFVSLTSAVFIKEHTLEHSFTKMNHDSSYFVITSQKNRDNICS